MHICSWGDKVSNLVKVSDGLADGAIFDEIFVLDRTGDHGVGTETIDQARDTLGVVKDAGDSVIGEKRTTEKTGELDMVVDVGNGLRQIKRGKVVSSGQPLVKGFVNGKVQSMAETRLTDKEQGAERLAVHGGREKEAELLESERGEEVSFVKNNSPIMEGLQQLVKGVILTESEKARRPQDE